MFDVGIMQGRLYPERIDRLQVFPETNWKIELVKSIELGFNSFELLFDNKLVCERLLMDSSNFNYMGLLPHQSKKAPLIRSICADYFTIISFNNQENEPFFYNKLKSIFDLIQDSTIKILIIPFFKKNTISSETELRSFFEWILENDLNTLAEKKGLIVALELLLPAKQIRSVFQEYSLNSIGICYDIGNARSAGFFPEEDIQILKEFIVHVHIKDRQVNGPNVMLGKGAVDFNACINSLYNINYNGQLILETAYFKDPIFEAKTNLQYFQEVMNVCL